MLLHINVYENFDEEKLARELAENPSDAADFFEALVKLNPADVSAEMSKELVANLYEFVLAMENEIASR